jgi:hypothetical protein
MSAVVESVRSRSRRRTRSVLASSWERREGMWPGFMMDVSAWIDGGYRQFGRDRRRRRLPLASLAASLVRS